MLTHGCNLFIQTVFKWFSAAGKLFLWHQSTRNCTVSLQGQRVSVYHNYYPLFVSVLLTLCWVSLGKQSQTAPTALSDVSADTRAALTQRACVQHFLCPGTCVQLVCDRPRGQWLSTVLGCAPSWSGASQPGTAEVKFASFIHITAHTPLSPLVIRFQKGTSCTHFQTVLSCFCMAKPRRYSITYEQPRWVRNCKAVLVPIESSKSANPSQHPIAKHKATLHTHWYQQAPLSWQIFTKSGWFIVWWNNSDQNTLKVENK